MSLTAGVGGTAFFDAMKENLCEDLNKCFLILAGNSYVLYFFFVLINHLSDIK